jgi:site-specific recombinase XerD
MTPHGGLRQSSRGDIPLDRVTAKSIRNLRNRKKVKQFAANKRVKFLRYLYGWAIEEEHVERNPANDVQTLDTKSTGHHTWTVAQLEQFEASHKVGTKPRLALDLISYLGVRRSDVVRLGRQHIDSGWIRFTPWKTRKHGTVVDLPICAELLASIEASPCGDLQFLITAYGKAFTEEGFGVWFGERCDEADLPEECTAHGVRKAAAARAAENGATSAQLQAMFGWLGVAEAERYTREASRKKLSSNAVVLLKRDVKRT